MKKSIAKNYDKIVLLMAIVILAVFSSIELTSEFIVDKNLHTGEADSWERTSEGVVLHASVINDLMPGDFIFYRDEDGNFSKIEISKIFLKRRSEMTAYLKSGKNITGRIKAKEGVTFTKAWKNSTNPVLLDVDGKINPIQMRQITKILCMPKYILADTAVITTLRGKLPYFYQGSISDENFVNYKKRPIWNEIPNDENNSIYELFTPPLIYLIDNKLTTTLPEAPVEEEEKEPFGVSVVDFSDKPYRFRLISWIGNSPYIEDTKLTKQFGHTVRNRLEVNNSYKILENPKPGRPSLIQVDGNSSDKNLTLKYFAVQNVTQKNGGVKPVGRALIEDHFLGIKPFEVNSLMEEVFLGQFEVKLRFKIGKEDEMEFSLTESDEGKEINYNGRKYLVLGFDPERKSLKLRKQHKIPHKFEDVELAAP